MNISSQMRAFNVHKIHTAFVLLVISLVSITGACSSETTSVEVTQSPEVVVAATEVDPLQVLADIIDEVQTEAADLLPLTFNVSLTENGPEPNHLFIPSSRLVQIVLRNHARSEVHYRVVGLTPARLSWIAVPEEDVVREVGVSDEDHDAHHDLDWVSWRATSRGGIQPTGGEVHGYTSLGELDVIRFIATNLGTYEVVDPLHPEFSAQLTVF